MEKRTQIVVTLDGSDLSEAAVPVAARLAADLDADVTLLRVVPPQGEKRSRPSRGDLLPLIDLEEHQAGDALRGFAGAFPDLAVQCVVLVGRHAAEEIVDYLRHHPVDFVVMATHGHSGLRHLVAGSVTDAVVRSGLAPVVAVRPPAVRDTATARASTSTA
jgi:nucleotide-binding universal stress UspA family protein